MSDGEYFIPREIMEVTRVAYDDRTLSPTTTNVLQTRDYKWLSREGTPEAWTSHGLPQGKFRLWPTPLEADANDFTWDSDTGITVQFRTQDGDSYTLSADPAVPGWDADNGILTILDDISTPDDEGEIFCVMSTNARQITIWGVRLPQTMSSGDAEIPIRRPWQIAVLWYILWQSYETEGELHNGVLAAFYRDQFFDQVERCKVRVATPIPAMVRALRGPVEIGNYGVRYGDLHINGVPQYTIWGE